MSETLDQIPPEAWPLIELMLRLSLAITIVWLVITVFVWWRRSASNLTPVNAARKNKQAHPDFLRIDKLAREAAAARGEAFDSVLVEKERREAAAAAAALAGDQRRSLLQQLTGFLSFFMSLFTLATMILGAIWQVSRMGSLMKEYSSLERIVSVIQNYPVSFSVAVLVIVYHIARFVAARTKKEG